MERKGRKERKKSAKVWQPREKAQTQTKKRERDAKKKGKKLARKLFFFFLFFVEKRSNLSRGVSLSRVVTLKRVLIPSSTTTTTTTTRTIIPLLPERRFRRCPTRIKTILTLIKTRSIAFARLRMPFRTTNGSRLAIYTPSFRSFPVALVGYDERCLFALQRWTRWWKQQQRQQQKRRR